MFEAYAVGVTLKLHNLISPQLALLGKEFEKLELLTVSLAKSLKAISVDSAGLRGLTTAANSTNRAFERANVSAAAFQRHLSAIHATGGGLGAIGATAATRVPVVPRAPAGGGRLPGGGHGPGAIHGGNIHLGAGGVGLGTVGMAAGDWFWPLAATGAAIYGGKALFDSAKDLNTEQNRFRLFGMSEAQNQEAFNYAKNMRIYGTTQVERLTAMSEAQGVFRESGLKGSAALEGSKLAAPVLSKLDFLASSLDEESQARMKTANLSMLRYIESSGGLKSASEFNRIADFGYKLNVSSRGTVNWEQLRQFKARAGAAGFHLSDEAMARLEPVIAEMKGGAVGFGLSTAFNRLTGSIRIPNQVAHQLVDQGIWDKSKIVFNSNGGIKTFTGNPLGQKNSDLLMTNPELFYETVIRPIYEKMKFSTTDIARENVMLFGTTGGRNMTLIENQLNNIHSSVEALKITKGINDAYGQAQGSLSGQQKEFEAAWTDFKTQWGTVALPFFTGILKSGAAILRTIGGHPNALAGAATGTVESFSIGGPGVLGAKFAASLVSGISKAFSVTTQVNLDGRKVAENTTKHQSKALGAPQTGISGFDSMLGLAPSGGP